MRARTSKSSFKSNQSNKSSRHKKFATAFFGIAIALTLAGCQGVNNTATNAGTTTPTIALNQSSVDLQVNHTTQFTATVQGAGSSAVTWYVDGVAGGNATVGTINASGMYTAPATAGSHTVSAAIVSVPSISAKATVAVGMTAVNPTSALVIPSGTEQFNATVQGFSNTAVTWSVDGVSGGNATVGTITTGGAYTAPAAMGTHTITATSSADASVTASASIVVTTISVSPASATIIASAKQQFTASIPGAPSTALTWSVDGTAGGNSTVGTISTSGIYAAPAATGSHTVTAISTSDPSLNASAAVSVFVFTLSPTSADLLPSGSQQFTASIQGLSNTTVNWSVDGVGGGNATTGTITTGGLYTAPSVSGSHTVGATSTADTSASVSATVTVTSTGPVSILTYHNDDARDGVNLQEVILTPSNVNSTQFGKLLSYPVDGQVYAQPLYMSGLAIAGGTHDVVFVATMNNSVYAFDADAATSPGTTFWHVGPDILYPAVPLCDTGGPCGSVGILSTPVIDASTNTMYLVSEGSPNNPTPFRLFALDVTTGALKAGPVIINGTVAGTGGDSVNGSISLDTFCYQRMGLALNPVTNFLYIAFGSCTHGWVFAYDKTTLAYEAIFNATPDGDGGGFWGGGAAPAIDDTTGDVYLMSGVDELIQGLNGGSGTGDPVNTGYNDSFLRLDPNGLSVVDYFTPADNFTLAEWDADLGSGGNVLVPSPANLPMVIGGGKDGNVFVVNRNDMGEYNPGGINNVIQTVQACTDSYNNIFSTPVYWNGFIYYHCNDNVLQAYSWSASNTTAPLSTTPTSKAAVTYQQHGATPSLSANGNINGIIWDVDDSAYTSCGCDPTSSGPLVLHAYNASNLTELYNSSQAGSRDTAGLAVKFTVPTVANGRVFVPTATELDIYGLLP